MTAQEPWLTKVEVARTLGVSRSTVERLKLPHMRVGGQNRYLMSEVETHLRGEAQTDNVIQMRPVPSQVDAA